PLLQAPIADRLNYEHSPGLHVSCVPVANLRRCRFNRSSVKQASQPGWMSASSRCRTLSCYPSYRVQPSTHLLQVTHEIAPEFRLRRRVLIGGMEPARRMRQRSQNFGQVGADLRKLLVALTGRDLARRQAAATFACRGEERQLELARPPPWNPSEREDYSH